MVNPMKILKSLLLPVLAVAMIGAIQASAQQPRPSPHEATSQTIDGNRVSLYYGRPHMKAPRTGEVRKVWGTLVPYGQVWRTGANEATLLVTQRPIVIGNVTVPAGAHTLFTLPQADGSAKLIINKQIGQWGLQYDEKQDLGRVDLTRESLPETVEQFTMRVERAPNGGGVIKLAWEDTQYSVPFTNAQ